MKRITENELGQLIVPAPCEHTVADISFGELLLLYTTANPGKSAKSRPYRIKKWVAAFGSLPAWQVEGRHIQALVDRLRANDYQPATIKRELTDVKAAYNWAMTQQRIAPKGFENPTGLIRLEKEKTRRVYLEDRQRTVLLAACKAARWPKLYCLALMALHTAARKGELLGLHWDDVDLSARRAILHESKSDEPRLLILSESVVLALKSIKPEALAGLVFCGRNPGKAHDFRYNWTKARKLAKLEYLHFHDLRHASAAIMLKKGINLKAVAQVLGHADTRMVGARYGHLDINHLQSEVERAFE